MIISYLMVMPAASFIMVVVLVRFVSILVTVLGYVVAVSIGVALSLSLEFFVRGIPVAVGWSGVSLSPLRAVGVAGVPLSLGTGGSFVILPLGAVVSEVMVFLSLGHGESFPTLFRVVVNLVGGSFEVVGVHLALQVSRFFVNLDSSFVLNPLAEGDDVIDENHREVL